MPDDEPTIEQKIFHAQEYGEWPGEGGPSDIDELEAAEQGFDAHGLTYFDDFDDNLDGHF